MNWTSKLSLGIAAFVTALPALAQITFYEQEGFRGRPYSTNRPVTNFAREGYNDRASSVIVDRGTWEVCDDANFSGRCVILRPGNYDSLSRFNLNNRVSSVRPARANHAYEGYSRPEPVVAPAYEYRRRPSERLREVPVTSVRAVMGPPERRCWVEREQVQVYEGGRGGDNNVGGAIVGGLIGGILGHQVGGGRGKDAATAAGAIAGVAIGANSGGGGGETYGRNVERCRNVDNGRPAYWDVTYIFRGAENRVQMSEPPGRTIIVNDRGEPRQP